MASSSVRAPITMRLPVQPGVGLRGPAAAEAWMHDLGGSGEAVEDARVVISELVANSVRHARPLADGQIQRRPGSLEDARLQLSVTDGGSGTRPRNVHAPSSALAGRGMAIVEMLAAGLVDRAHRLAHHRARPARTSEPDRGRRSRCVGCPAWERSRASRHAAPASRTLAEHRARSAPASRARAARAAATRPATAAPPARVPTYVARPFEGLPASAT